MKCPGLLKMLVPILAVLTVPAHAQQDMESFPLEGYQQTPSHALFDGVSYRRLDRGGEKPAVIHIIRIDLTRPGIRFMATAADHSKGMDYVAQLTSDYLKAVRGQIGINGNYFLPWAGGSPPDDKNPDPEDFYPKVGDPVIASGAVISNGKQVSPPRTNLDIRVNAIICFGPRMIAILDGQRCVAGTHDAVAAGPRLLADGQQRSFLAYDNHYAVEPAPRTAFGISRDHRTAWIIVCDGRQPGYSVGESLSEITQIYTALGASDAINLDGGGSSTMAMRTFDGKTALLNRPIHTGIPGRERPVADQIVLFARPLNSAHDENFSP